MEPISHDENDNPKSLGRIGFNTVFKNKIQFKNNYHSKKIARTPLKSKLNLMNSSQEQNSINSENEKKLRYPLLKSISSSNINLHNKKNKNISYNLNSNEIYDYDEEDEDEYNKDALPDEIEDFMHVQEKEINIVNDVENLNDNIIKEIIGYKRQDIKIFDDSNSPFGENNNYVLAAHLDDDEDDNINININYKNGNGNGDVTDEINNFNCKKKFEDYFNEPDDIDML